MRIVNVLSQLHLLLHLLFATSGGSAVQVAAAGANAGGVIAVLGSSVARGFGCSGNCSGYASASGNGGCYQARLKVYQQKHARSRRKVLNSAINGDDTSRALARLPGLLKWVNDTGSSDSDQFVLVGLSLANQGFNGVSYRAGVKEIIRICRAAGVIPVIGLCYANGLENPSNYALAKSVNLEFQQFEDVATINFLGSVDDGFGGWASGHWLDAGHPNDAGQMEMYLAIVPSLFDALKAGIRNPSVQRRKAAEDVLSLNRAKIGVQFSPAPLDLMHSFTLVLEVRSRKEWGGGDIVTVVTSDGKNRTISISKQGGYLRYQQAEDASILLECPWNFPGPQPQNTSNGNPWYMVSLSHFYARGETILSINGVQCATSSVNVPQTTVQERLVPKGFLVGAGHSTYGVDCRDLLVYRAGLNQEELAFLWENDKVLQGSLEVFAPLRSANLTRNFAQSLSTLSSLQCGSISVPYHASGNCSGTRAVTPNVPAPSPSPSTNRTSGGGDDTTSKVSSWLKQALAFIQDKENLKYTAIVGGGGGALLLAYCCHVHQKRRQSKKWIQRLQNQEFALDVEMKIQH